MLIHNGVSYKELPIVVLLPGSHTHSLAGEEDIRVGVTRSFLFVVYIFELHPCRDIGGERKLLHEKRHRDSFNFQKIKVGINFGVSCLLKENHYLSPDAVRFLSTSYQQDVVPGDHLRYFFR